MLDVMYEAPSRTDIKKVVVTKDLVERRSSTATRSSPSRILRMTSGLLIVSLEKSGISRPIRR